MATYEVNLWGSHPDAGNDDQWSGETFESYEKALEVFNHPTRGFSDFLLDGTEYVEMVCSDEWAGVFERSIRHTPEFRSNESLQENPEDMAELLGMGMGLDAYNDYMGY